MDCALGTTCHSLRHVHVLMVERARHHLVQFRPPEFLDLVAARHAVVQVDTIAYLKCVLSCSLVGEVCPLGRSSIQPVERLVKRLSEPETVLPHPVDCFHRGLSGTSLQVVNRAVSYTHLTLPTSDLV